MEFFLHLNVIIIMNYVQIRMIFLFYSFLKVKGNNLKSNQFLAQPTTAATPNSSTYRKSSYDMFIANSSPDILLLQLQLCMSRIVVFMNYFSKVCYLYDNLLSHRCENLKLGGNSFKRIKIHIELK